MCPKGEKPFRCHYSGCGKLFDQSCNLNKHYMTHIGHKPYSCNWPLCGEKFSQSSNLTKHLRKHTGDNISQLKCDVSDCDAIFTDANSFIAHKLKHSNSVEHKESETSVKKKGSETNIAINNEIEAHRGCQTKFNFETMPLSLNL